MTCTVNEFEADLESITVVGGESEQYSSYFKLGHMSLISHLKISSDAITHYSENHG